MTEAQEQAEPVSQSAWSEVWGRATSDHVGPAARLQSGGVAAAKPVRPDAGALSVFFRSLATMTAAGVMIDRALDHLGKHTDNPRMANLIGDVARRVSGGVMLSTAFAVHGYAFSDLQLRMLVVGERTGSLHVVLARLADYEEKRRATTMKVQAALIYPMFLMVITTFMLIVLPPYMFQGLFQMIEQSAVEPPMLTQMVLAVSNFIRTPWFWLGVITAVGLIMQVGPWACQHPKLRIKVASVALRQPVVGHFLRTLATARFARALELQLQVGECPIKGLSLACSVSGNPVLENSGERMVSSLINGKTFVGSMKGPRFFPAAFLHMASAGEESGRLPDMLGRVSSMLETELDHSIDQFSALLEPMIMLVMGVLVGIMVVATMMPMMSLIQTL